MDHVGRSLSLRSAALPLSVALAGVPGLTVPAAHGTSVLAATPARCTALGTYQVGEPPYRESAVRPRAGLAAPARAHSRRGGAIPVRPWTFHGTLVLSGYRGCGPPTQGTFAVRRTMVGPPPDPSTTPGAAPLTGVLEASGTFTQDPAHATNAAYITVSATITATHLGLARGAPCSTLTSCPTTAVTTTTTFTSVTGYLQGVTTGGRPLLLSFLPPPAPSSGLAPTAPDAVIVTAWRSR